MFTGLVEAMGVLRRRERRGPSVRFTIEAELGELSLGESIAVNGVCLTVAKITRGGFEADLSPETLARTTLGELSTSDRVHLERATPLGGRMGGHMVLGHVDGVGKLRGQTAIGEAKRSDYWIPAELGRFVAEKGSIAIDGVSLTVNGVAPGLVDGGVVFDVMLVPHTLERTTLGAGAPGHPVNIEVDVLARYVARQLAFGGEAGATPDDHSRARGPHEGRVDPQAGDQRLLAKLKDGGYI
jgi:riboflavin synthase